MENEAKEAVQHMREIAGRMEQAEGALETARGQADGVLEGLAAKAADVKEEAGELLEKARKAMAESRTMDSTGCCSGSRRRWSVLGTRW